jgi:hypothetical protein
LSFVSYLLTNGWKNKEISIGTSHDLHRKKVGLQITQQHFATLEIQAQTLPAAIWCRFNPLTPELNPSAQRFLTRFLMGILLLEPCISLTYA